MKGNGLKLHQGKFGLNIRKHFFTERFVKCYSMAAAGNKRTMW